MSRQKANIEILNRLYQYVTDSPDIRLGQALVNMGVLNVDHKSGAPFVHDPYYEEPQNMIERMDKEALKQSKGG